MDLKTRLLRDCEAMTAYLAARGMDLSLDLKEKLVLLDLDEMPFDKTRVSQFIALHEALALSVRPALPETLELLHWDAGRLNPDGAGDQGEGGDQGGRWQILRLTHWLAPVSAIRKVMCWAMVFFVIFFATVIFGPLSMQDVAKGLPAFNSSEPVDDPLKIATLLALFTSLAGIGACFLVMFDAHRYIAEGIYDPRQGQNYGIRIGLGLMSGLLLSQVLPAGQNSDSPASGQAGNWVAIGRPILALVGGFSGQLVYSILSKLVTSVESLFEEDRRQAIERAVKAAERSTAVRSDRVLTDRNADLMLVIDELLKPQTAAERDLTIKKLMGIAAGVPGAGASARPMTADIAGAAGIVAELRSRADYLGEVIDTLMPEDRAMGESVLARLTAELARLEAMPRDQAFVVEATRLAAGTAAVDALGDSLGKSIDRIAAVLAVGPPEAAGIARAMVTTITQLQPDALMRLKQRVLGGSDGAGQWTGEPPDPQDVLSVLDGLPQAQREALAIDRNDAGLLVSMAEAAVMHEDDDVLGRFASSFGGDDAANRLALQGLRDGLADLRQAALQQRVAQDIPALALQQAGQPDGAALLEVLDDLVATPEGLAEVDRIALLAMAGRKAGAGGRDLLGRVVTAAASRITAAL